MCSVQYTNETVIFYFFPLFSVIILTRFRNTNYLQQLNKLTQHLYRGIFASVVPFSKYPLVVKGYRIFVIMFRVYLYVFIQDTSSQIQQHTIYFLFRFQFILMLLMLVKIPSTFFTFKNKISNEKQIYKKNFTNHLTTAGNTITPENMKFFLSYLFLLSTLVGTLTTHTKSGRKFIQSNLLQKVLSLGDHIKLYIRTLCTYNIVFG